MFTVPFSVQFVARRAGVLFMAMADKNFVLFTDVDGNPVHLNLDQIFFVREIQTGMVVISNTGHSLHVPREPAEKLRDLLKKRATSLART